MLSEKAKVTLRKLVKGKIFFNEPMRNHTSLRIGGPADVLIIPKDELDLKEAITFVCRKHVQIAIIGFGTKLLVSDYGFSGAVIKIGNCLSDITISGSEVNVGAGCLLPHLSWHVGGFGLSGLEFAVGIPGTVGGAIVMNAGAHGRSLSDVITSVKAMNSNCETEDYSKEELGFGYRQSLFQRKRMIVLSARLNLRSANPEKILKRMHKHIEWRKNNQPLDLPNAGSIFKNPQGLIAGKLIAEAGLSGLIVGGAQVSEKRGNFIVNLGNATAADVLNLIGWIQNRIYEKYNIQLELEIQLLGF
jgi:UDP-N-acetylmuramate dehydrogenase